MKFDVNQVGLSVAAAMSVLFTGGYLALAGVFDWKFHPYLHYLNLGQLSVHNVEFAAGEFIGGLLVFALWGYIFGAVFSLVYNRLGK